MLDGVGATAYSYDAAGQILSEDGPWADDTVSYTYANRLRMSLSLQAPNADAWAQSYGYDAARRLTSLSSPAGTFGYAYDALRSTLPAKLSLPNGAYITNTFDSVALLLATTLQNKPYAVLNSHQYGYNQGNQRIWLTNTLGDFRNYVYDNAGQLLSDTAQEPGPGGNVSRLNERLTYTYDAAGNLSQRRQNFLVENFAVNPLNELSNTTRSGTLTVAGTTTSPATNVAVNSLAATLYRDSTFAKPALTLVDGTNIFTAIAMDSYGRTDSNSVTCYLPATNLFVYDLNGNLRTNGNKVLEYDDENQLTAVTVSNAWRSEFAYDGKMRRRIRRELTWQSGIWNLQSEIHYVYDGMLAIQERDANNLPTVSYTRGRDLSRSVQGAGGLGGLLARTDFGLWTLGSGLAHSYYHCDANGNITRLINTSNSVVAKYLYDPFGNTISMSGPLADANLYRFSSKETHSSSGMYYYGYRFYEPSLQRWVNRDPILEAGGINHYAYVANRVPNRMDPFGLADGDGNCPGTPKGKGDNCYQYACGTSGPNSDIPGAKGGQRCPNPGDCDAVKQAGISDGLTEVPPGGCPDGTHKVGYAAGKYGGSPDSHWFRESNDGKSWCYKFRNSDPSNLDGDGKPITDPKPDDIFNFPGDQGHQPSSYTFCGFLCAPGAKQ